MPVKTRVSINNAAVVRIVAPIAERAAYTGAQTLRSRVQSNISSLGRVNTGLMKNSIQVRRASTSAQMKKAYTVASKAPYVAYQENGTRAHGPRRARRLVFQIRGRGPVIYAKWVRGVTPGRFFYRAMKSMRASDFVR
jgi:hypothetical protein